MIFFHLPWIVLVVVALLLLFLSFREWRSARLYPPIMRERGIGFFHSVVLFIFFLAVVYGSTLLFVHAQKLGSIVPIFPDVRYAPEREAFVDRGTWVFVSSASLETIRSYYASVAERLGYRLTVNVSGATARLLLAREKENIFLTVKDEGSVRVLFYSKEGEVRTVPLP